MVLLLELMPRTLYSPELIIRLDDKEDTVRKRLEIYHSDTKPLIDYYNLMGIVNYIDGENKIKDVSNLINEALNI